MQAVLRSQENVTMVLAQFGAHGTCGDLAVSLVGLELLNEFVLAKMELFVQGKTGRCGSVTLVVARLGALGILGVAAVPHVDWEP